MEEKEDIVFSANDFGFTFEDDNSAEIANEQVEILSKSFAELQEENQRLESTNREIMKRVTLLLNSLKSEPEKEVLRWPNRSGDIDRFLKELNQIYKSKE